jgi:hypothetical protein
MLIEWRLEKRKGVRFMKKLLALMVITVFAMSSIAVFAEQAFAAGGDNAIDKVGDWWATRGKEEPQKSMILAQRQSERAAKRAQQEMKKAGKEMNKSLKKAFGN